MSIKGHNDNQYTKEKDAVERYLLRIIQRYFDIEKNFTKESTEAIILEALKRFKQHIASQTGYIFALNGLTGDITLTIQDFGGEPMIDKQTAFNKDFGDIADTVCEGNDPRLYDARIPLEHVQTIDDIKGLREELTKIVWPTSGFAHSHANQEILDALVYTGRQAQIDLIALEQLEKAVIDHCNKFSTYNQELVVIKRNGLAHLQEYIANISKIVVNAKEFTENAITWLTDAYAYTDANVSAWKNEMFKRILSLVTQTQAQVIIDALKNGYMTLDSGEFALQAGTVSLVPIEEENITEAGSGQGDSLLQIYNEGLRLGTDDWVWNDATQSFIYTENISSYSRFISLSKFDTYTHRVTFKSISTDDDTIATVIAYDKDTGNDLSLIIHKGGMPEPGQTGSNANIVLNFNGTGQGTGLIMSHQFSTDKKTWSELTYGVTVLVKRNKNNFKIWLLYDAQHLWIPEERDGIKDIYPTEEPIFDFNLTDYPSLNPFVDKECNYGYGCYSQASSTYADVYFISQIIYDEPYGHTNISETSTTSYSVSLSRYKNGRIKLYFRYDKNGEEITAPLPFHFKDDISDVIIQGTQDNDGKIDITCNLINKFSVYATEDNIYNGAIIAANSIDTDSFYGLQYRAEQEHFALCKIDSAAKNTFVSKLLKQDTRYLIDGQRSYIDGKYYDNEGNVMQYLNWDSEHPIEDDIHSNITTVNGKWQSVDGSEPFAFVAEYKVRKLTEEFDNPRIYYEVLGTEEVV